MLLKKLLENVHEIGFPAIQFCRIIESNCFRTTRIPAERIWLPLGFSQVFALPKSPFRAQACPVPAGSLKQRLRLFNISCTAPSALSLAPKKITSNPRPKRNRMGFVFGLEPGYAGRRGKGRRGDKP